VRGGVEASVARVRWKDWGRETGRGRRLRQDFELSIIYLSRVVVDGLRDARNDADGRRASGDSVSKSEG